jgi:hypothetical protein
MRRVGILVGREQSLSDALLRDIGERGRGQITAELVKVGGVRLNESPGYDLVIDRVSHEVPFFRAYLRRIAMDGTIVINNPFMGFEDDRLLQNSLASKLGLSVPKTVLLPQKEYPPNVTSESLRNLEYPIDWQGIVDYVGLPAILRPLKSSTNQEGVRIDSLETLWREYDRTGTECMVLEQALEYEQVVRCYCLGEDNSQIVPLSQDQQLDSRLRDQISQQALILSSAMGNDLSCLEFSVREGMGYLTKVNNSISDSELLSLSEAQQGWLIYGLVDLVLRRLQEPQQTAQYKWEALSPIAAQNSQKSAAAAVGTNSAIPSGSIQSERSNRLTEEVTPESKPKAAKRPATRKAGGKKPSSEMVP